MYLLKRIEVWAKNRLSRVVKTPKMQFIDSGLLATLAASSPDAIKQDRSRFCVLETFVFAELLKHATTTDGEYGKSTLWQLICGNFKPASGTLQFDGQAFSLLKSFICSNPEIFRIPTVQEPYSGTFSSHTFLLGEFS